MWVRPVAVLTQGRKEESEVGSKPAFFIITMQRPFVSQAEH